MIRTPSALAYFGALIALAMLTGLVGCSQGNSVSPPATQTELTTEATPLPEISDDGMVLGYYQFVFEDDSVRVEEVTPDREAEFDVTGYVMITIVDFWFNEQQRNWYVTAKIKNVSPYTGYDVRAVFHTMGNKFVLNTDGFMWVMPPIFPEPTRCPFVAYAKDQPNRMFPPLFEASRTIVIHQPTGIPKLAPLGFWIDARGVNRTEPMIEDLVVEKIDDTNYHLTGHIWDHQSPSEDLTAWADTSKFNGLDYTQLFDDGEHGDGGAGDGIWGCDFSGDPEDGPYRLTVYAWDPEQNQGENDVWFLHGLPCDEPIQPWPYETIDKGEQSGIQELTYKVINGPDMWEAVWQEHTSIYQPPPPVPPVNFENHTVIGAWLGPRPSNNHHLTIVGLAFDPCEDLLIVHYQFTPYAACGPADVMTYPFHIIILPKYEGEVYFHPQEVDCPPPPPECIDEIPFETLIQGYHSGIHEPYELKITGPDQFGMLWQQHTQNTYPPPPPPDVNFELHDVIAVGLGNRPSTGFHCIIQEICKLETQQMGIFYLEKIPGPGCETQPVITQPFHWVIIQKNVMPPVFFHHAEVYSCPSGGCNEVPHWFKADGEFSCEPHGRFPIFTHQALWAVWTSIWCDNQPPPMPPVNWDEEVPFIIQGQTFPTTGYYFTVDGACIDAEEGLVKIEYTRWEPADNCPVEEIETQPWIIESIPWVPGIQEFEWIFILNEMVYECPPCEPMPWWQLADGSHSCAEPGSYGYQGFGPAFEEMWSQLHCGDPTELPPIPDPPPPFENKPFVIQVSHRPTTGYYITIDDVCLDGCDAYVKWTLHEPADNCETEPIQTKPWVFGVAAFPPIDCEITWHFQGHEEVYDCEEPCYPVPFYKLEEGQESCEDVGEYGWQNDEGYVDFWHNVHCYDGGDPPPPLPEDPEPIEDGIIYHFGIQLPWREESGHYITIDEVCIEGCDVFITYTENIPADDCDVDPGEFKPWMVGAVELPPVYCYWTWHFEKKEAVYDCPDDDCWDFWWVAGGPHSGGEIFQTWFIQTHQEWYAYWMEYHPDDPFPPIDFEAGLGAYVIHLGERPTTGYEVEVYEICEDVNDSGVTGAEVRWVEWIPGDSCNVEPVVTSPWTVVKFHMVDLPYWDEGIEEVYECG